MDGSQTRRKPIPKQQAFRSSRGSVIDQWLLKAQPKAPSNISAKPVSNASRRPRPPPPPPPPPPSRPSLASVQKIDRTVTGPGSGRGIKRRLRRESPTSDERPLELDLTRSVLNISKLDVREAEVVRRALRRANSAADREDREAEVVRRAERRAPMAEETAEPVRKKRRLLPSAQDSVIPKVKHEWLNDREAEVVRRALRQEERRTRGGRAEEVARRALLQQQRRRGGEEIRTRGGRLARTTVWEEIRPGGSLEESPGRRVQQSPAEVEFAPPQRWRFGGKGGVMMGGRRVSPTEYVMMGGGKGKGDGKSTGSQSSSSKPSAAPELVHRLDDCEEEAVDHATSRQNIAAIARRKLSTMQRDDRVAYKRQRSSATPTEEPPCTLSYQPGQPYFHFEPLKKSMQRSSLPQATNGKEPLKKFNPLLTKKATQQSSLPQATKGKGKEPLKTATQQSSLPRATKGQGKGKLKGKGKGKEQSKSEPQSLAELEDFYSQSANDLDKSRESFEDEELLSSEQIQDLTGLSPPSEDEEEAEVQRFLRGES